LIDYPFLELLVYNISKEKQIRNLLLVFGGGIAFAFLFAAFMLYHYSPTGKYYVKNTVLAPDVLDKLAFKDTSTKTGASSRYVFDQMEFSYYDTSKKQWIKLTVSKENYAQLYHMISDEGSLMEVPEDVVSLFNYYPASLVTTVRSENKTSQESSIKTFQEVYFANKSDYFRIALQEQGVGMHWVYFYHPGIYQKVINLFVQ
jgi:hypothetical protein